MKTFILAALAASAVAAATPATAQYGRLVPPDRIVRLHDVACMASAPDFEKRIPILAKAKRWDEYGVSAKAKPGDRAWLVAIDGMPLIVDISRKDATQRCSVNAVTDPSAVLAIETKVRGRKPDSRFSQGPNGNVNLWHLSPGRTISVTIPIGQALSRITIEAAR